ncbi:MAG: ACP phosphodiesterase [Bacteroidales bacterium]|nr:ACP phosphodiesterase [Bacteroidales bacterium]
MNLLAHAYLSGDHEGLLIGNFIADHIHGNKTARFPNEVQKGIRFHRLIDYYTDNHEVFIRSTKRLHGKYGKYAGVIVDVLYDHFLGVKWHQYSPIPLSEYTTSVYAVLLKNYNILPSRTKKLLPHIMIYDWLSAYSTFEGLEKAFVGLSRRVKYNPGIEHVLIDFKLEYKAFDTDFDEFFPKLKKYAEDTRLKILAEK